ncbi:MAG: glycosyltransferase family 2 protein [Candidatus Omnitrophica bacterium]|nr:glycosyltransferase family 2 protein [Candidatus Omnitrophota bacterium]
MYKCDIIVVTWNKLDYIKECAGSILRHTDVRSRLIIVDNASDESTRSYLKALEGNGAVDIKLIFNDTNLGPGMARNKALAVLEAENVCFVDSDVVVTPGWLSAMIAVSVKSPGIGMVNPSSNNFNQAPPKGVTLDDYSRALYSLFKDSFLEVGHSISFCMLIKSEVVRKIGFIDEEYVLALYEDTDYSMKATAAGYSCVIAKGAYVWHYGHGSTGRVKRINAIAEKNRERFYKKWGRPLRIFWCAESSPEDTAFGGVIRSGVELARDGNYVYIYGRGESTPDKGKVFGLFGLTEHANVHVKLWPGPGLKWICLLKALSKRKKAFDLIVADESVAALLKRFASFYKAKITGAADHGKILGLVRDLKRADWKDR